MFTVNETTFGWEEIIAAAEVWGDWQRFFDRTKRMLACLKFATETGQLPSNQEVRDALTSFRYAHNLISGEETQAWLNRWELTLEELTNYLRGQLLIERWANKLEKITADHSISGEAVTAIIKKHTICADLLGQWAIELAGRSAVAASSGLFDAGDSSERTAPRELIARIEAEFLGAREQAITPQKLQARIADHRLDWVRFDCRYLWFTEERVAREAVWCITEDGLTMDEVAKESGSEARQWSFYLDEIDANVRAHFLAARQGDWLGPLKYREGFPIFSILEKRMPSGDDPLIRQRAEKAIVANMMEQAINERVKWGMQ
ncbi:MAG: hypothetical protein KA368_18450 [Acidobacteria bacterium]|nr:hypothetical protein [Acidobacteriota bacterium]